MSKVESIPMPLAEVVDRYTICLLKLERLPDEDAERLTKQVKYFEAGVPYEPAVRVLAHKLREINGKIWDAEAAVRAGQDQALGLEEIGRRALAIRDLNRERIALKNQLSAWAQDGMEDVKVNHASQEAHSPSPNAAE